MTQRFAYVGAHSTEFATLESCEIPAVVMTTSWSRQQQKFSLMHGFLRECARLYGPDVSEEKRVVYVNYWKGHEKGRRAICQKTAALYIKTVSDLISTRYTTHICHDKELANLCLTVKHMPSKCAVLSNIRHDYVDDINKLCKLSLAH